jgi:type I restriction enzyme S subunit
MDAETAALVPAEFEDSELGMIPKGWRVEIVGDCAAYLSRGVGPVYLEKDGICVLNQKCIRDHRVDFSKARRHDSAKKPINGRELQPFDVLVNSTGTGTLGRVAQIFQLPERTIVDSHVTIVRPNPETDPFFFGLNLIGREDEIEALAEGSTGQTELSRTRLGLLKIVIPSFEVQSTFGQFVRPLLFGISYNEAQSRTLAALRNTLLPRLLSGELSVADISSDPVHA